MKKATKKSRLEAARAIIDGLPYGAYATHGVVALLNSVLGVSMKGYQRRGNNAYPSDPRHLHVSENGIDYYCFSWRNAIECDSVADYEHQSRVSAARLAVTGQANAYMEGLDGPPVCSACGLGNVALAVDHKTTPFSTILDAFIAKYGTFPVVKSPVCGTGGVMAAEDEWEWRNFHAGRADYQILCRSCNSKKGKKAP